MQNRIRELRKDADLSLEDLAKKCGTTKATIMKLEKGSMQLTTIWIDKIATALGKNPLDLISAGRSEVVYKADEKLMHDACEAIATAAKENGMKLTFAETMAYSVRLYNYVMDYRSKGKEAYLNEAMAALILKSNSN